MSHLLLFTFSALFAKTQTVDNYTIECSDFPEFISYISCAASGAAVSIQELNECRDVINTAREGIYTVQKWQRVSVCPRGSRFNTRVK